MFRFTHATGISCRVMRTLDRAHSPGRALHKVKFSEESNSVAFGLLAMPHVTSNFFLSFGPQVVKRGERAPALQVLVQLCEPSSLDSARRQGGHAVSFFLQPQGWSLTEKMGRDQFPGVERRVWREEDLS